MPRADDLAVRVLLVERAARMLRDREPVTLRSLVHGTGVSTMAVYTRFGGVDGLWRALRQEGFTRLATRFAAVQVSDDPVRDLAALIAEYVHNARENPDLYRVMFDASVELEDLGAADATLEHLVQAVLRARDAGRLREDSVPLDVATRSWAVTHGVVSLVAGGPLAEQSLEHVPVLLRAILVDEGDHADRARRSVDAAWSEAANDGRPAGEQPSRPGTGQPPR